MSAGVPESHHPAHHALTRRLVSARMPPKMGCLWGGGTFQRVLKNFFLLSCITIYSFHPTQVFTESLLCTRHCARNWGDRGTKRTGSLLQEPVGQSPRALSARPGGCAGVNIRAGGRRRPS